MPTPMRPWTVRLLALVDEGVTNRYELIERVTPSVPLGHAYRKREYMRRKAIEHHRRRHPDAVEINRPERTMSEIHRIGARQVLDSVLNDLVRSGRLVRDGVNYRRPLDASATAPHSADEATS